MNAENNNSQKPSFLAMRKSHPKHEENKALIDNAVVFDDNGTAFAKTEKFIITETRIDIVEKIDGVELEAELRDGGWWVSDGYMNVTVANRNEAYELLKEWADDAENV